MTKLEGEPVREAGVMNAQVTSDVHLACRAEVERVREALREVVSEGHRDACKISVGRCNCSYSAATEALA